MTRSPAPRIPRQPQAAHAATEVGADDTTPGDGSGVLLWPVAVLLAVAAASFIAWACKR